MGMSRMNETSVTPLPTWMREAVVGGGARQLLISYRPVASSTLQARLTAGILRSLRYDPTATVPTIRVSPRRCRSAGVLTKMDRFNLAYAATAIAALQSRRMAGSTALHLSDAGLCDPELPIYVISQFKRHGVSPVGVRVTLAHPSTQALPR